MALTDYFGYDGKGRAGRRTVGLRPPFGGKNRLMFITRRTPAYTECDQVRMAIRGGCSWIQLRVKEGLCVDTVRKCAAICAEECGRIVDLCVNDDLEAAVTGGATACHLGKKDMPLDIAWEVLGERLAPDVPFYIGATANTFEDIRQAVDRGASYIGLGPYRFTDTKKNLSPLLGLEGYRTIIAQCREAGMDIPIFAIGGITREDVGPLMETGITGIAVSGAIVNAPDPAEETRRFIAEINTY
ncbi:thiamine phosphate synthase [Parabacteroides sp. ZJ-118]|uniref:thiamine phosphate synthase n=1 Tax=Parabacteroides sp. ZJ-118 TaxID=2709398 RepID=UPI0013EE3BDB|nr:thiamine phosphate synthase [Parabacteroides sp. ZJ-118]